MRLAIACSAIAVALCGCSSVAPTRSRQTDRLSFDIGDGVGSQYGNYEMLPGGETHDADGDRCVIFNWDRPLNKNYAIRYSSESCESKDHPIWMNTTAYMRTVIPMSQSNLKNAPHTP
jgi:hypothetical protein